MDRGLLEKRADLPSGYGFDRPFARAWVVVHTLSDVGLVLPIDHTGRPGLDQSPTMIH